LNSSEVQLLCTQANSTVGFLNHCFIGSIKKLNMKVTFSKLIYACLVIALISGFAACNGTDSSDKTKDSLSTKSENGKSADSATTANHKKKRKRHTSLSGLSADSAKIVKDKNGVYNRAETAPEFPGGQTALADYFNSNITNQSSSVNIDTSRTLQVAFVVDENGKVMDPKVINSKSSRDELANETVDAFNKMPSWTPGMVHGKKVKTRMVLPLKFDMTDTE
jgi:hypothetical protein